MLQEVISINEVRNTLRWLLAHSVTINMKKPDFINNLKSTILTSLHTFIHRTRNLLRLFCCGGGGGFSMTLSLDLYFHHNVLQNLEEVLVVEEGHLCLRFYPIYHYNTVSSFSVMPFLMSCFFTSKL